MTRVDLVFPGLLNLPADEFHEQALIQATPTLQKLLRFAEQKQNRWFDIDQILVNRLRLKQAALPYAQAMNYSGNQHSSQLFKPVYLQADINNAILSPVDIGSELNIIINDLQDYFKVDFYSEELSDNTWVMHLHDCPPVQQLPHYLSVLGKTAGHYLDQIKTHADWFKLLNEIQMYLYQHAINQRRQQEGLAMVNSLWCWGADPYQGEFRNNTDWYCDDVLMQGIGELYTGQSRPISSLKEQRITNDAIIVDLSLLQALKGGAKQDVFQLLTRFEENCLQPVINSAARDIVLHTAGPVNFHYHPGQSWKIWKKPIRLTDLATK